ncbi:VanZ family protein [Streptococcus ovuberis]|uniref:VanZ family protein n=1 Tax=Streptococcus ovuberis TaxID=1936207 RepID=A0A7X6MZ58_9STRE|nr:VanZ family protein [Streptococcus ovuberis]NKZ20384.1 VanZ family protein [Streptococcus ovuberis]
MWANGSTKLFDKHLEPTPLGRRLFYLLAVAYILVLIAMCFTPQQLMPQYKDVMTPGIIQVGRVYLLLIPLNSFVNAGQIDTWSNFFLILLQNIANVLLLIPLVFCCLVLFPKWRSLKKALLYSFFISLGIEMTQIILDVTIDAGRVFEIDDLWTNSLGGGIAYCIYSTICKAIFKKERS